MIMQQLPGAIISALANSFSSQMLDATTAQWVFDLFIITTKPRNIGIRTTVQSRQGKLVLSYTRILKHIIHKLLPVQHTDL
jgi:hypothetical protein